MKFYIGQRRLVLVGLCIVENAAVLTEKPEHIPDCRVTQTCVRSDSETAGFVKWHRLPAKPRSVHLDISSNLERQIVHRTGSAESRPVGQCHERSIIEWDAAQIQQIILKYLKWIRKVRDGTRSKENRGIIDDELQHRLLSSTARMDVLPSVKFVVIFFGPQTPDFETRSVCIFRFKGQAESLQLWTVQFLGGNRIEQVETNTVVQTAQGINVVINVVVTAPTSSVFENGYDLFTVSRRVGVSDQVATSFSCHLDVLGTELPTAGHAHPALRFRFPDPGPIGELLIFLFVRADRRVRLVIARVTSRRGSHCREIVAWAAAHCRTLRVRPHASARRVNPLGLCRTCGSEEGNRSHQYCEPKMSPHQSIPDNQWFRRQS